MIIHEPEILEKNDHTIVWAKIELGTKQDNFPDFLWYRLPKEYTEYVCLNSDAFLVPGLIGAMHFGEDIQVRGTVSPKLAYHLDEYQFLMNFWMPEEVHPVSIKYQKLAPANLRSEGVACTFSGGVDSWFTLWNHLPQNQPIPDFQLTHALFINLFDITNRNTNKYLWLSEHYRFELQKIGIEMIPLETNLVRIIIPRLRYLYFFSIVLAGSAMLMQGLFKRFYVASAGDHRKLKRRLSSSNPLMERLLSTDTLDIIHFGAIYSRHEKIETISEWPLARQNIRVCGIPDIDEQVLNCSRCEKCMRTMFSIYALGKMEQFTSFQKVFTTNRDTLLWARKFNPEQSALPALFQLIQNHKPDLLPWLRCIVFFGSLRYRIIKRIPESVKSFLQRFGYFMDLFKEENAFERPEIIQAIRARNRTKSRDAF